MGMAAILVNGPMTILAIFRSPNLRWLHMKFEQNWLKASEEKSFENNNGLTHGRTDVLTGQTLSGYPTDFSLIFL